MMPSQQQLKGRIRSVKSTKQITKAMQMVAACKMRRAQEAAKEQRLRTPRQRAKFWRTLSKIGATDRHPLFEIARCTSKRLLIVVASDRGSRPVRTMLTVSKLYVRELIADDKDGIKTKIYRRWTKSHPVCDTPQRCRASRCIRRPARPPRRN